MDMLRCEGKPSAGPDFNPCEVADVSLVLTLASRNLLQDRLRFIASLIGIVLSVVLVMVQLGLYNGFGRMLTIMVDHASADLWVVSSGAKFFEDLSLVDSSLGNRLSAIDGVDKVIPVVAGFSAWSLPDGAMIPVFVVASDFNDAGLLPWNVVEGSAQSLTTAGTVAIDRAYLDRLGVSGAGATTLMRGLPVRVGAVTEGIRSFATTPYVFSDLSAARSYIGLPENFTSDFLVQLKPGADIEQVRQQILSKGSGIRAFTPDEFREQSRSFWLFGTGAGAALFGGAVLAFVVGTVIVAQTLYSSTKEHLYEFASLRAIGASNGYIYKVITCQALINAVIGFTLAALIGAVVVRLTSSSALQVVITTRLTIELFALTVVMSIVSAFAAILRVIRVDPAIVLTR
jgi:putative ABC transport system permease protein